MAADRQHVVSLLQGPLWREGGPWPLLLSAVLCDLRPRFLDKGRAGRGYRAIARNGRILLASPLPLAELAGRPARLRLQTWHRAILPGDRPEPSGLLLCVDASADGAADYTTRLVPHAEQPFALALDVGGGRVLEFRSAMDAAGRGQ
jgi:hypothetical protein